MKGLEARLPRSSGAYPAVPLFGEGRELLSMSMSGVLAATSQSGFLLLATMITH